MEPLGLLLNPSRDVGEGTYFPTVQRDHIITFSGLRVGAGQRNLQVVAIIIILHLPQTIYSHTSVTLTLQLSGCGHSSLIFAQ